VEQEQNTRQSTARQLSPQTRLLNSHYAILGLHPSASAIDIRRAYRELSKRYHPDTTLLAAEVATFKFQRLNEAYAILSNPERRSLYDLKIGYSRYQVPLEPSTMDTDDQGLSRTAYLDPNDRPLSAGEIFALCLLGLTLVGCLGLALLVAWLRGDALGLTANLGLSY
jgi:hypothetical protein